MCCVSWRSSAEFFLEFCFWLYIFFFFLLIIFCCDPVALWSDRSIHILIDGALPMYTRLFNMQKLSFISAAKELHWRDTQYALHAWTLHPTMRYRWNLLPQTMSLLYRSLLVRWGVHQHRDQGHSQGKSRNWLHMCAVPTKTWEFYQM